MELSAERSSIAQQRRTAGRGDTTPGLSPESDIDKFHSPRSPSALENIEAGLGRLLLSGDGKSRYVGPNFWATISEEVCSIPIPSAFRHITVDAFDDFPTNQLPPGPYRLQI